jgi:hypothetical protein
MCVGLIIQTGWFHGPKVKYPVDVKDAPLPCRPLLTASDMFTKLPPLVVAQEAEAATLKLRDELEAIRDERKTKMGNAAAAKAEDALHNVLDDWVSRDYRKTKTIKSVNTKFLEDSRYTSYSIMLPPPTALMIPDALSCMSHSIQLHSFLRHDKYEAICRALQWAEANPSTAWVPRGPANKRHYSRLSTALNPGPAGAATATTTTSTSTSLSSSSSSSSSTGEPTTKKPKSESSSSSGNNKKKAKKTTDDTDSKAEASSSSNDSTGVGILSELEAFLSSREFTNFLNEVTGLDIVSSRVETRRFGHSDYTLAYDGDPEVKEEGLDAVLCLLPPRTKWYTGWGGSSHYLLEGEKDELLTVMPADNTLSLVFRSSTPKKGVFRLYVSLPFHVSQSGTIIVHFLCYVRLIA